MMQNRPSMQRGDNRVLMQNSRTQMQNQSRFGSMDNRRLRER
jgi:hypothetical protein